jgi:chitinase
MRLASTLATFGFGIRVVQSLSSFPGGTAIYWGQTAAGSSEKDLMEYCSPAAGVDIVVLAFLYQYGNGNVIPAGQIGECVVNAQGEPQSCDSIATAISTCRSNGIKVILSLGGANGGYSLQSVAEAQTIGQNLWDAYGRDLGTGDSRVPRPFGDSYVDGWDFDIESSSGSQFYQYLISTLRGNFDSDPNNTYYITGAPQCSIPETNMGTMIRNSIFDVLWIQFYNTVYCSNPNPINYDDWIEYIAGTNSSNADIWVGLPAAPLAANSVSYYVSPQDLVSLVEKHASSSHWGGIMMWSAAWSESNVEEDCTYAQEAKHILNAGSPCSPSSSITASALSSSVFALPTSSGAAVGSGVPQPEWSQVSASMTALEVEPSC